MPSIPRETFKTHKERPDVVSFAQLYKFKLVSFAPLSPDDGSNRHVGNSLKLTLVYQLVPAGWYQRAGTKKLHPRRLEHRELVLGTKFQRKVVELAPRAPKTWYRGTGGPNKPRKHFGTGAGTSVPVRQIGANAPVRQCASAPMRQCLNAPVRQCLNARVRECADAPVLVDDLVPAGS